MRAIVLSIVLLVGTAIGQQPKEITNSIGMKLVLIPAGTFAMGSPMEEVGRRVNETYHEVTISKSFYLGAYEVTQGEYEKVMGANPSRYKGPKNPVGNVSWNDAVSFCKKLSETDEERRAGRKYRIPTEAEWEYACRAGSTTAYSFGDTAESFAEYAWFQKNAERRTHPVGEKKPNRWGLYDMHGNVWEYCQDLYADYPPDASTDPQGHNGGTPRVNRGGGGFSDAAFCRAALRNSNDPMVNASDNGFRVALSPSVKQPEAITNSIGMKLVLIHAGSFTMGSPRKEQFVLNNERPHDVTISESYYLGVYEVTQHEYEKVMGKNPSHFSKQRLGNSDSSKHPVETITWNDAVSFCKKLSETEEERRAGREYRLPTEAEWEYACRAGSGASFCFGDPEDGLWDYAWFGEGAAGTTHPVGGKKPNRWGLYDMHGNIAEWCQDWFADHTTAENNPKGPDVGRFRVIRGGVYELGADYCRSWDRVMGKPTDSDCVYGFRIAMSPPVKQPEVEHNK